MALSMKNTLTSLTLSGVLVVAGYLSGESPQRFPIPANAAMIQNAAFAKADAANGVAKRTRRKAERAFTTPYFSFGKSNFTAGVSQ
jgi:hypothetical protein